MDRLSVASYNLLFLNIVVYKIIASVCTRNQNWSQPQLWGQKKHQRDIHLKGSQVSPDVKFKI